MTTNPPPLPHEELYLICRKAIGESIWAIEMGATKEGKFVWWIYCSDKRKINKIPDTFRGRPVEAVYCKKPRILPDSKKKPE
jgi:hypothetical protein